MARGQGTGMLDAAGGVETPKEQVRAADVIASLCLATDLGMGFPFEHGLSATLTTMRLCDAMGVDTETAHVTFSGRRPPSTPSSTVSSLSAWRVLPMSRAERRP